jgi:hypothetical protein
MVTRLSLSRAVNFIGMRLSFCYNGGLFDLIRIVCVIALVVVFNKRSELTATLLNASMMAC